MNHSLAIVLRRTPLWAAAFALCSAASAAVPAPGAPDNPRSVLDCSVDIHPAEGKGDGPKGTVTATQKLRPQGHPGAGAAAAGGRPRPAGASASTRVLPADGLPQGGAWRGPSDAADKGVLNYNAEVPDLRVYLPAVFQRFTSIGPVRARIFAVAPSDGGRSRMRPVVDVPAETPAGQPLAPRVVGSVSHRFAPLHAAGGASTSGTAPVPKAPVWTLQFMAIAELIVRGEAVSGTYRLDLSCALPVAGN